MAFGLNDGGSAGMGGAPWLSGAEAGLLGLGAIGSIGGMIENRRKRKQLAQLRKSMLEEVDAGASNAKGGVAAAARTASGNATQSAIDRGFYNSTVASDAQSGITLDAAERMGDIESRRGSQRAQILADTFDRGGGVDLSGLGQIGGMILANRLGGQGGGLGASAVAQAAGRAPAVTIPGGDPNLNAGTFDGAYSGGGAVLESSSYPLADQQIASAMRRRKWTYT